jgi:hypothetical protein
MEKRMQDYRTALEAEQVGENLVLFVLCSYLAFASTSKD